MYLVIAGEKIEGSSSEVMDIFIHACKCELKKGYKLNTDIYTGAKSARHIEPTIFNDDCVKIVWFNRNHNSIIGFNRKWKYDNTEDANYLKNNLLDYYSQTKG
jgi:hypothetical protein